jgi:hypothetical protein
MNFPRVFRVSLSLTSIVLSSFLVLENSAQADVAVSPMIVQTTAKRGQARGLVTIYNLEQTPFRARVYTSPFTYDKERGFQALPSSPNDLAPYLQLSPKELNVNAANRRNIRFIVRFPPSLPDGEYRTMIFTENLQATNVTETDKKSGVVLQTAIVPRIGVAVYVHKGKLSPNLSANSATFDPKSQNIRLLVTNKGKASAVIAGEWKLTQGNQVIQSGLVGDTTVIAEGERYVSFKSTNSPQVTLPPGNYEISGKLGWGENKSNTFPFKATLTVPPR